MVKFMNIIVYMQQLFFNTLVSKERHRKKTNERKKMKKKKVKTNVKRREVKNS